MLWAIVSVPPQFGFPATNLCASDSTSAAMEYNTAIMTVYPPPMAKNTGATTMNCTGIVRQNRRMAKVHVTFNMVPAMQRRNTGLRPILHRDQLAIVLEKSFQNLKICSCGWLPEVY